MNPGYLSFIIICIVLILIAYGWKDQLTGYLYTSNRAVVLFLIGWIIVIHFNVPWFGAYQINLCYLFLLFLIVYAVVRTKPWLDKVHFITIGLLIGAVYILLNQLVRMDPIIMIAYPYMNRVAVITLLAVVFIRQPLQQIAAVTIGIVVGDFVFNILFYGQIPKTLGNLTLYDQWWLICLSTRLFSEIIEQVWNGCKTLIRLWLKN